MEFLTTLITGVAASLTLAVGKSMYERLAATIREQTRDRKAHQVLEWLNKIGNCTEADIRRLVEDSAELKKIPPPVREDLILLLSNLTHNARFHTTNGTRLSSYLRCEKLIEQLLDHMQPARSAGEPVAEGNDWILESFLGMGGFGEVWKGRNPYYPRPRAFKFFTDATAQEWLRHESAVLSEVKQKLEGHPNIVDYHDIAVNAKPFPYLAFEFVEHRSLEDRILEPDHESDFPLEVESIFADMVDGLAEAHSHKIYHCDIKPANILLAAGDERVVAKIADFGLGQIDRKKIGPETSSIASRSVLVGTHMYLPPEAAMHTRPDPAKQDIFALGVTGYQMLIRRLERPPYDFADRLLKQGFSATTVRLLSQCLAHPDRRFTNAEELQVALNNRLPTPEWDIPDGFFDVGSLALAYLEATPGP